jgi:hypothetical protein
VDLARNLLAFALDAPGASAVTGLGLWCVTVG